MKKYTEKELQKILKDHKLWLSGEGGKCADLTDANLRFTNLYGANLYGANLTDADLRHADLRFADLSNADLTGANLIGANLSRANLSRADLSYVNLSYVNLNGADLNGANLSGADLSVANLSYADFIGVKFGNTLILGKPVNKAPVQLYDLPYNVLITDTRMKIGCKLHSIDNWLAFTVEKIEKMDGDNAKKFYEKYGDLIKAAVLSHRVLKEENKES